MPRPLEIRDIHNEWQSIIRQWMDGQNITATRAAELAGVSRTTVQRLLALPDKGTTYGRKRWKASFLNYFLRSLKMPANMQVRVNILAALEEGYKFGKPFE